MAVKFKYNTDNSSIYTRKYTKKVPKTLQVSLVKDITQPKSSTIVNTPPVKSIEDLEEAQLKKEGIPSYRVYKYNKAVSEDNTADKLKESVELNKKGQNKIANEIIDFGTRFSTLGTQFRFPTQKELEDNRGSIKHQAGTLANATSWGLANMMIPDAASYVARTLPEVGPAVKTAYGNFANSDIAFKLGKPIHKLGEQGTLKFTGFPSTTWTPKASNTLKYVQENKVLPMSNGELFNHSYYKNIGTPKEFYKINSISENFIDSKADDLMKTTPRLSRIKANPILTGDNAAEYYKRDWIKGYRKTPISGYKEGERVTKGISEHYGKIIDDLERRTGGKAFGSAVLTRAGYTNKLPGDIDLTQFVSKKEPYSMIMSDANGTGLKNTMFKYQRDLGFQEEPYRTVNQYGHSYMESAPPSSKFYDKKLGIEFDIDRTLHSKPSISNSDMFRFYEPEAWHKWAQNEDKLANVFRNRNMHQIRSNQDLIHDINKGFKSAIEQTKNSDLIDKSLVDLHQARQHKHISGAKGIMDNVEESRRDFIRNKLYETSFATKPLLSTQGFTDDAYNSTSYNMQILKEIGIDNPEKTLLNNPKKVKELVDDYITQNTIYGRGVNDGNNVLSKEFVNPPPQNIGGEAYGAGAYSAKGIKGFTSASHYGYLQNVPDDFAKMSDIDKIKAIKSTTAEYGTPLPGTSTSPSDIYSNLLHNTSHSSPVRPEELYRQKLVDMGYRKVINDPGSNILHLTNDGSNIPLSYGKSSYNATTGGWTDLESYGYLHPSIKPSYNYGYNNNFNNYNRFTKSNFKGLIRDNSEVIIPATGLSAIIGGGAAWLKNIDKKSDKAAASSKVYKLYLDENPHIAAEKDSLYNDFSTKWKAAKDATGDRNPESPEIEEAANKWNDYISKSMEASKNAKPKLADAIYTTNKMGLHQRFKDLRELYNDTLISNINRNWKNSIINLPDQRPTKSKTKAKKLVINSSK